MNGCKTIMRLAQKAISRRQQIQIFNDFIERTALTISNKVDPTNRGNRGKRLAQIEAGYSGGELAEMNECLKELVSTIRDNAQAGNFEDVLGRIFEECGLCDRGQDFTFMDVAALMSNLTMADKIKNVSRRGYVDFYDGACGAGSLLLAAAKELDTAGINYTNKMVAYACDIDRACVHMTYIQLSQYGIPAVVVLGNTITEQEYERWYTPMYIFGKWVVRRPFKGNDESDIALKRATFAHYEAVHRTMELFGN